MSSTPVPPLPLVVQPHADRVGSDGEERPEATAEELAERSEAGSAINDPANDDAIDRLKPSE